MAGSSDMQTDRINNATNTVGWHNTVTEKQLLNNTSSMLSDDRGNSTDVYVLENNVAKNVTEISMANEMTNTTNISMLENQWANNNLPASGFYEVGQGWTKTHNVTDKIIFPLDEEWLNMTADQYLEKLNLEFAGVILPAIVVLASLLVVGVVGNSCVLYVYGCRRRRGTVARFIQALAVFDLLSCCLAIPGEITDMRNNYTFGRSPLCRIVRTVNLFCTLASGGTLVVVAIDRYKRICCPLRRQITPRGAVIIVSCCAGIAAVLSLPTAALYGAKTVATQIAAINGTDCSIRDRFAETIFPRAYNGVQMLLFLTGAAILVVLYSFIGRRVFRHNYQRQQREKRRQSMSVVAWPREAPQSPSFVSTPSTASEHGLSPTYSNTSNNTPATNKPNDSNTDNNKNTLNNNIPKDNFSDKNIDQSKNSTFGSDIFNDTSGNNYKPNNNTSNNVTFTNKPNNKNYTPNDISINNTSNANDASPSLSPSTTSTSCERDTDLSTTDMADQSWSASPTESSRNSAEDGCQTRPEGHADKEPDELKLADQENKEQYTISVKTSIANGKNAKSETSSESVQSPEGKNEGTGEDLRDVPNHDENKEACVKVSEDDTRAEKDEDDDNVKSKDMLAQQTTSLLSRRGTSFRGLAKLKRSRSRVMMESAGSRRTTMMLFVITLVYVLSFLPHLALMMVKSVDGSILAQGGATWRLVLNLLIRSYFINSVANPIIYGFFSRNFIRECRNSVTCCCR